MLNFSLSLDFSVAGFVFGYRVVDEHIFICDYWAFVGSGSEFVYLILLTNGLLLILLGILLYKQRLVCIFERLAEHFAEFDHDVVVVWY